MIIEKDAWFMNGYLALIIITVMMFVAVFSLMQGEMIMMVIFICLGFIMSTGITFVQPNQAVIVQFLGRYIGTFRQAGIVMFIPFSSRKKVSLRVRAYQSKTMQGFHMEGIQHGIAMMLVFKIVDAAKAIFDVENIDEFIDIQGEMALRNTLATDSTACETGLHEIAEGLKKDMRNRLYLAGIELMEVRLFPVNHPIQQGKQAQLNILIERLLNYMDADVQTTKIKG